MRGTLIGALLLAAAALGGLIGFFNATPVPFNYLAGEVELPLIALLLAACGFGVLVTLALGLGKYWRLGSQIRHLRRQLRDSEAELKNLRNLPLKDA